MDGMKRLWAGIADLWCSWTHGGGIILRDPLGRVNWQCNKCGRWSDPVSHADEAAVVNQQLTTRGVDVPFNRQGEQG